MTEPAYAELVCASNFSFLHGTSHGSDLVGRALELEHAGLGICDRNTVAGVVRAWVALREACAEAARAGLPPPPFRLVTGARLVFADGTPDIVAYPRNRGGWGRLCRLLSQGNLRADKGDCVLALEDLLAFHDDLLLVVLERSTRREGEGIARPEEKRTELVADPVPEADLLSFPTTPRPHEGGASAALESTLPGVGRGPGAGPSGGAPLPRLPGWTPACAGEGAGSNDRTRQVDSRSGGGNGDERKTDAHEGATIIPFPARQPTVARDDLASAVRILAERAPGRVWLGAAMPRRGPDRRRLARLGRIADAAGVPLLAHNDVLHATAEDRPLGDVLTAIRLGTTVHAAGRALEANAERHLKPAAEMARLFRDRPDAIAETTRFLGLIAFDLGDLKYEYPHEPVPEGWRPQKWLQHLVVTAARDKWPEGVPRKIWAMLAEEFRLIHRRNYAYYFLTVHDVVHFARKREPPILCQGRGSAANSMVCYLLGITAVDPAANNLLFSRFLSEERNEPPDIDVDFEHERREEVMQYIYDRYGRHRAGIVATVIHYRSRSAVREVGKALGLTEDVTGRLVSTVWGSFSNRMEEARFRETGFSLETPEIARLAHFTGLLLNSDHGFPRHLSQHVGGFVLTEHRLDETVPIHHGAMDKRTFIEWDKDDIDAIGLMKVDVLALGMLTCLAKAFDLIRGAGGPDYALATLPPEEPDVYDMLCRGDSIGVFQVESRAQMNMLPRLKPRELYDLVIQVAIVRPGPIQGDMVHPYLRRRAKLEVAEYPSPDPAHGPPDELFALLGKTHGVPLFQEQAMKLAITAARFTPDEANRLRRAMATFRHVGGMNDFRLKLVGGMTARGYAEDFAERCYKQIEGFGSYGFPESHAQSFALLVYASAYVKARYPAAFCAALLNSQPMGFYAPAQIVRCAREHEVEVRGPDVAHSAWDCTLEPRPGPMPAVRLGLRQIDGFRADWAAAARAQSGEDMASLARRLPARALRLLADADAFRSLGLDRRQAAWEVRRLPGAALPLFAAAEARELGDEPDPALPAMPLSEHVAADYQTTRLSLKEHPMTFLRPLFAREGIVAARELGRMRDGARARVAGVVLVRQRPGTGNAIFVTLEDETGVANLLMWARDFERNRRDVMAARLLVAEGVVQVSDEGVARVVHLMTARVADRTAELARLSAEHQARQPLARADVFAHPNYTAQGEGGRRHPRDVRIMPPSRDFH